MTLWSCLLFAVFRPQKVESESDSLRPLLELASGHHYMMSVALTAVWVSNIIVRFLGTPGPPQSMPRPRVLKTEPKLTVGWWATRWS